MAAVESRNHALPILDRYVAGLRQGVFHRGNSTARCWKSWSVQSREAFSPS